MTTPPRLCRGTCSTGRHSFRGFTLVELALVAAIIAIVAAMAVPRYAQAMERYRVEAATERIIKDLAHAAEVARTRSAPAVIRFDPLDDSYAIEDVHDPDRPSADYVVRLDRSPYGVALYHADFNDQPWLAFDGYGQPQADGVIIIGGPLSGMRVIRFDAQTAKAVVQ
jgi:prepilin-type N-terminal cleavage/methylation domain-containing protein